MTGLQACGRMGPVNLLDELLAISGYAGDE